MAKEVKPCVTPDCSRNRLYGRKLCYQCLRADLKKKKEEKIARKKERKIKSKTFQLGLLRTWNNKTWKLMSLVVRKTDLDSDGYGICFTCGAKKHYTELQAGHRYHRALDYDFRNVRKQCKLCNGKPVHGGKSGNLGEYELRLCALYGHEWCKKLKLDANTHPGYTLAEVMAVYYDLKEKLSKLP